MLRQMSDSAKLDERCLNALYCLFNALEQKEAICSADS